VVGGGIIGLSLARELRKHSAQVVVVERGEPGREASHAAAGMLVGAGEESAPVLQPFAQASARLYPEFVHELEDESGMRVDLRAEGTLVFLPAEHQCSSFLKPEEIAKLEPAVADPNRPAVLLAERSVDPRALVAASVKAARHRGIDISTGVAVTSLQMADGHIAGVGTAKTTFHAAAVVNCAGAWAGQWGPHFPTRPVKGQMLSVVGAPHNVLRHVVRAPEVYLVPRSDGRVLIGATVEEAGFDKRTVPETIQGMHRAALRMIPALGQGRILENWAGLRPGTPDDLPILGATATPGYFVATGHFRDGILLAPITAQIMARVVMEGKSGYDISAFAPGRFAGRSENIA